MVKRSAEILYDAIIDRILRGDLQQGAVLSEVAVAAESGLSRTPVREALQRLRREHVLKPGARRTLVVRSIGRAELQALFEALGEVEGICARLAARRMTDAEIFRLRQLVDEGDAHPENFDDINRRFHDALHLGAGNPVLEDVLRDLQLRSLPLRTMQFRAREDRIQTSQAEHRGIMDALAARDADLAERRMVQHMAVTQSIILDLLAAEGDHPARR